MTETQAQELEKYHYCIVKDTYEHFDKIANRYFFVGFLSALIGEAVGYFLVRLF